VGEARIRLTEPKRPQKVDFTTQQMNCDRLTSFLCAVWLEAFGSDEWARLLLRATPW